MLAEEKALELINRRRRQIHVHSVIYYHMHMNLVDDATFDKWSVELASLQRDFPKSKIQGYMPGIFHDWTGDTGMHLPTSEASYVLAQALVRTAKKKNHTTTPASKTERWEGDVGYERN